MEYLVTNSETALTNGGYRNAIDSCRFCHEANLLFVSLINNPHILDEVESFLSIKIEIDEESPKVLCYRCLFKIESGLEIRRQCLKSEHQWRRNFSITQHLEQSDLETTARDCEQLSEQNRILLSYEKQIEDVIKVVDPNKDYESDSDDNKINVNDYEKNYNEDGMDGSKNADKLQGLLEVEYRDEITDLKDLNISLCKYCDRAFTNNEHCAYHEKHDHNTKIPYICNDCMIGFRDFVAYSNHLRTVHQNDKPFQCVDCQKSFARRAELRKHSVVHTGLKPFKCTYCSKAFSRNTNLMKHVRIDHADRRPFGCDICSKRFNSKSDVSRHIAMTHAHFRSASPLLPISVPVPPQLSNGYHSDNGALSDLSDPEENLEDKQHNDYNEDNLIVNNHPLNSESEFNDHPYPQVPAHLLSEYDRISTENSINFEERKKRKYVVKNQEMLNRHTCEICFKRFSSKKTLRYHTLAHKGQQALMCGLCNKQFIRKKDFDRHLYSHSSNSTKRLLMNNIAIGNDVP